MDELELLKEARRILVDERKRVATEILEAKAKSYTGPSTYALSMVNVQAAIEALDRAIGEKR
jgi:hypothetical protein